MARLFRWYLAAVPWVGLVSFITGFIGAVGTIAGLLPPLVGDAKLWPRVSNAILWVLVMGQGFEWMGDWLEEEEG